jgi:H+-transporting ATPase
LLIGLRWLGDLNLQADIPLDARQLQTVMFLQLAVGGHLLLFVVRTKRFLFEPPYPNARLFWAIDCDPDRCTANLLYRVGRPGDSAAAIAGVWIYCLVWMIILDVSKLLLASRHTSGSLSLGPAIVPDRVTKRKFP